MNLDTNEKAPARVERFDSLNFLPRFEYPEMAEVVEICGEKDGSHLGTGFARFNNAHIPWTIKYDEVLIVIEGMLTVHIEGTAHQLAARDSLWLPAGTQLVYESKNALVVYAIHPSNWQAGKT